MSLIREGTMKKDPGKPLSATFVDRISDPGTYGDGYGGKGLKLVVKKRSSGNGVTKSWTQTFRGKTYGHGSYPEVSLADAREKAETFAKHIADGKDPRAAIAGIPIFADVAEIVVNRDTEGLGDEVRRYKWNMVSNHALVHIGDERVDQITSDRLYPVFEPIWSDKHRTAHDLLKLCKTIFEYCKGRGYIEKSPIGPDFEKGLGKYNGRVQHHASLPYWEAADAIRIIRQRTRTDIATRSCLQCIVYSGLRLGSARRAKWPEIQWKEITNAEDWNTGGWQPVDWDNLEAGAHKTIVWFVPPEHMKVKNGKVFRLPVSTGLLRVLKEMWDVRGQDGRDPRYIFPSIKRKGSSGRRKGPLGRKAVSTFCIRLDLKVGTDGRHATTHGYRSTISNWFAEIGVPYTVAELTLAHELPPNIRAYLRTDLLEQRARALQAWSDRLDGKLEAGWRWDNSDAALMRKIDLLLESQLRAEEREARLERLLASKEARLTEVEAQLEEERNLRLIEESEKDTLPR